MSKIIQIIQSPDGFMFSYVDKRGLEVEKRVACLALLDNGVVIPLAAFADGSFEDPTTCVNFARVYWRCESHYDEIQ